MDDDLKVIRSDTGSTQPDLESESDCDPDSLDEEVPLSSKVVGSLGNSDSEAQSIKSNLDYHNPFLASKVSKDSDDKNQSLLQVNKVACNPAKNDHRDSDSDSDDSPPKVRKRRPKGDANFKKN